MSRLARFHAVVPVLIAAAVLAVAQEAKVTVEKSIPELLDKARAAAKIEDWDTVITSCQAVIDLAQEKQGGILAQLFPKPPKGWTREDPEVNRVNLSSEGQSFSNVNITCRYIKKIPDGDGENEVVIEALVTNMEIAVQSMKSMLEMKQNVQVMKMMGLELFERNGFQCLKQVDPDKEENSETSFYGFGEKTMIQVHGPARYAGEVEEIFKLFELKKVLK